MKGILFSLLTVGTLVLAALPFGAVPALSDEPGIPHTTADSYTVGTDKTNYDPGETVHIFGGGFAAQAHFTIKVIRPDGSVVTGDGSFGSWPTPYDMVTTDDSGAFQYDYVLDGIEGEYEVR